MRLTVLSVPAADADVAADRLWTAGGRGVEEVAVPGGVELRTVLAADDAVSSTRLGRIPSSWSVTFVDVDDAPSDAWRDYARPIRVNDELTIAPAWLPNDEPAGVGRTVVEIEPAGSFGLGDHPTTRLSADATWRAVNEGDRVLDVGCGSGVLAIVAALRGACQVVATDIAEAAREATVSNAARNGVSGAIEASTTPLDELEGQYDIVLANILAPTLISLADDLVRLTKPGGRLVISGILADRHEHVLAALAPMTVTAHDVLDGWTAIELIRRPPPDG